MICVKKKERGDALFLFSTLDILTLNIKCYIKTILPNIPKPCLHTE